MQCGKNGTTSTSYWINLLFMNNKALEKASKIASLSPREISKIRSDIVRTVSRFSGDVEDVLEGKKRWTTVQFGLYKTLLNKVCPDISSTYVETSPNGSSARLSGLSREELEEMVRQRKENISNEDQDSLGNLGVSADVIENNDRN